MADMQAADVEKSDAHKDHTVTVSHVGTLAATGHRYIKNPSLVRERLEHVIRTLKSKDDTFEVISGGAEGADKLLVEAAQNTNTPYSLYLPNNYYLQKYPRSVTLEQVANAKTVHYSVVRETNVEWRDAWTTEKWWTDNFKRNKEMMAGSQNHAVVSPARPSELANWRKGGIVHAVKLLATMGAKVIWVPDDLELETVWVQL